VIFEDISLTAMVAPLCGAYMGWDDTNRGLRIILRISFTHGYQDLHPLSVGVEPNGYYSASEFRKAKKTTR
jgi:hypothetical protein